MDVELAERSGYASAPSRGDHQVLRDAIIVGTLREQRQNPARAGVSFAILFQRLTRSRRRG
jgi:hypothetical protein